MDAHAQSAVHRRLRRSCAGAHRLAEAHTPFFGRQISPQRLGLLLARLEALWDALERRVRQDARALAQRGIFVGEHLRLPLLQSDRRFWGAMPPEVRPSAVPLRPEVAAPGWARAMGCLYVLCGARLGGDIVGRHLQRKLAHTGQWGLTFWLKDAAVARPALVRLMRRLQTSRPSVTDVQQIGAAAQATFASYSAWMGGGYAQRKL